MSEWFRVIAVPSYEYRGPVHQRALSKTHSTPFTPLTKITLGLPTQNYSNAITIKIITKKRPVHITGGDFPHQCDERCERDITHKTEAASRDCEDYREAIKE